MRPSRCGDEACDGLSLLTSFLDNDDRPTFILDAHDDSSSILSYQNDALRGYLSRLSAADTTQNIDDRFHNWASSFDANAEPAERTGVASNISFGNRNWTSRLLHHRWRVVFATAVDDSAGLAHRSVRSYDGADKSGREPGPSFPGTSAKELQEKAGLDDSSGEEPDKPNGPPASTSISLRRLDWIKDPPKDLPPYHRFLLDHDWASTPLGPISGWPDLLRQTAVTILSSPDPRLLLWGRDMCLVYNEACLALIGQKHPRALGRGPAYVFSELWKPLKSIINRAMQQGKATRVQDLHLSINRDKDCGLEETYWTFTMLPIIDSDGTAIGALDEFVETTNQVIGDRRMNTLITLGEKASSAKDIDELWSLITTSLEPNSHDVTYALLYSVRADDQKTDQESEDLDDSKCKSCYLEGTVGVSDDHPAAIPYFRLTEGDESFSIPFRRAWTSAKPVLLRVDDETLTDPLADLRVEGRGFSQPSTTAIVLPIPPLSGTSVRGFLVMGLNPRRPYDEDYQIFIRLLNDRLVKAVASIFLPEEQRRSRRMIEENNSRHDKFSSELERRRQEAESGEATFTALAECAPVGCVVFQLNGQPLWMNEAYLDLSGLKREDFGGDPHRWSSTVIPEDREYVEEQWEKLVQGVDVRPFEFRVRRPWHLPGSADESDRMEHSWVLANAFLKYDEAGNPQRILAWLTDISHQKWSQQLQAQRLEDVLETKRQSENFIDMTSHEMRNPLSAILQSADGILVALGFEKADVAQQPLHKSLLLDWETQEVIIDSAQTIVLCAQHQKRIVDDIVLMANTLLQTLSKLDSKLLVICPDLVQPVTLVERAIKMYEAELALAEIKLSLSIHQSYDDLAIDLVYLDPSRFLQVLINLLTNAIKFTRDRDKRAITIFLSGSLKQPSSGHENLAYIPRRSARAERNHPDDECQGEEIFLQLAVEDTGKGLSENEMKLLFHRFSQASPKTYGEYGGSGLGLFISRELTELQDGQIGVASQDGRGSTFAFYIKTRRGPSESSEDSSPPSPLDTLRIPPLRRPSSSRRVPSNDSNQAEMMPLTSPSDPSWNYSEVEMKNVAPSQPIEAHSKTRYPHLKVLIVEDNLINQRVLAKQLRHAGCSIHIANHGLEALDVLARSTFSTSSSSAEALVDISVCLMVRSFPTNHPPLPTAINMILRFLPLTRFLFEYSIHTILFQRGVYPAEDFSAVKKYGLTMMVSSDDQVKAYIKKIMSQLSKWMLGSKINKLVVVITSRETGEHVERWQFDVQIFNKIAAKTTRSSSRSAAAAAASEAPASGEGDSENASAAEPQPPSKETAEKTEAEIQSEIQSLFRQITASVTFLPMLDGNCTFNVLVYADADSDVPVEWGDSDAKEIENGEKVQLRSFSTSNHRVDTLVSYR
ncbi:Mitotic spindle checkpoint component mad2 [Diplodia seriata]|uniref:histidine kinase n=1 Tax=Diplodia seriata TaxID=420778 RepID=A0A1S8B5K5_9PEZI|nr:Mitotic spindle checkpoint component mad2 [Diplodia seriata]